MPYETSNAELIDASKRMESRRRLGWAERYVQGLEIAVAEAKMAKINKEDLEILNQQILHARTYIKQLTTSTQSGLLHRRKRSRNKNSEKCYIYIDECGSHEPKIAADGYPAFVLAATIISDTDRPLINSRLHAWKRNYFVRDMIIHEADMRRQRGQYWANEPVGARNALYDTLRHLPFKCISIVIDRVAYTERSEEAGLDPILPAAIYNMALDFLCERIVMALAAEYGGAKGILIAEARGPAEDARLQHEFVRLQLDGTSYISEGWFRQQLSPSIVFHPKKANLIGLQIADLLARPCGDHVLGRESETWDLFKPKMVRSKYTLNTPLGIKIFPWNDEYLNILEEAS